MTATSLIHSLKSQGLTNRDIIDLYKEVGRQGLESLVRS
jgi:hypothetical protein